MSVLKDKERGTWMVSYYLRDSNKKYHHYTKRGFPSKKEAEIWEKLNAPTKYKEPAGTFMEFVQKWEEYMYSSPGSIRQHTEHFTIRFAKYKDRPIEKITKADLIEWRAWLSKQPYATKTKNCTISYVKGVFKFANDVYDIPNVATILTRLKKTDEEIMAEFDVWTPEEFEQFISYVEDPEYKLFFEFLFWTGCRRGEAIALQKADVLSGKVNIKYSQRDRSTGLKPTKTRQRRQIQLDNSLRAAMEKHMKNSKEGSYVFGGNKGLAPTTIDRRFERAIVRSSVKNIRLHDLRHSHATWLINNGVNIVAVSKRLGHTNIEQTLKTYTHLLESSDQNMMEKINKAKTHEL